MIKVPSLESWSSGETRGGLLEIRIGDLRWGWFMFKIGS